MNGAAEGRHGRCQLPRARQARRAAERAALLQALRDRPLAASSTRCGRSSRRCETEGDAALVALRPRARQGRASTPAASWPREAEFDAAFEAVDAGRASRRSASRIDNIRRFHEEQKPEPMWLKEMRPGAFAGDRWHADPVGGALRAARQGRVPLGDDDDLGAGGGRRRAGDRHRHAAGARRLGRCRDAGRGAHRRRRDGLQVRRRARPSRRPPTAPRR